MSPSFRVPVPAPRSNLCSSAVLLARAGLSVDAGKAGFSRPIRTALQALAFIASLALLIPGTSNAADQNGFGFCTMPSNGPNAPGTDRQDGRLGRWRNPGRPGHGWDFFASGNDGSAQPDGGAMLVWYTYQTEGIPEWFIATTTAPAPSAGTWTAQLRRIRKLSTGQYESRDVGEVSLYFAALGDPAKTDVRWRLYGSSDVAASPQERASVTGQSAAITQDECIQRLDSYESMGNAGPSPTEGYAGIWRFTSAALQNWSFNTSFFRVLHDWNEDGIPDEDKEIEHGAFTGFGATSGSPRWGVFQREVEAIQPQLQPRALQLNEVLSGYCAWCSRPQDLTDYSVAMGSLGSMSHDFASHTAANLSASINHSIGTGKDGAEPLILSFNGEPIELAPVL